MNLVETDIRSLRHALDTGRLTSVGLVAGYLARIGYYDHHGIRLNAVPVLNPAAFAEARAADERRGRGERLGPLDGIPFTAKNSYKVRGLTVAAGSPAFADLVAAADAFSIARLRAAGAICLGLTTMPPMANGGMQRGVHGRAESPYNATFLTSAWASGSSNGSGTATAAGFAAFGLGEETWSSGRAPANNNGLVAYTPSWGVISMRGNWPLVSTMDVVVPHTRTVDDLFAVLNAIVADDPETRGDFWRVQPWVDIAPSSALRPACYHDLGRRGALAGKRIGMPSMYLGRGADASPTRPSVVALAEVAAEQLRRLGAEVVETGFPLMRAYESTHAHVGGGYQGGLAERGFVPAEFAEAELIDLAAFGIDDFLRANAEGGACGGPREIAEVDAALVFPTSADIAPSDADTQPDSHAVAWRNGTWVANGNLAIRHLGIPTVTVPMGMLTDIGMPSGLTYAGRAWRDADLLAMAWEYDEAGDRRVAPPRTPELSGIPQPPTGRAAGAGPELALTALLEHDRPDSRLGLEVTGEIAADGATDVVVTVNGEHVPAELTGRTFRAVTDLPGDVHNIPHSIWRAPYGSVVVVTAHGPWGEVGRYLIVGGV